MIRQINKLIPDGQCLRASNVASGYVDNGYLDQDFLRVMPFLLSTQTVCQHATKGYSNMIGNTTLTAKRNKNAPNTKFLSHIFIIPMQISAYKD